MRLLGLEAEAQMFYQSLAAIYENERQKRRPGITEETFRFWSAAAANRDEVR